MRALATRLKAYAELGRVSNLPTCLTNVLTGCVLGVGAAGVEWSRMGWIAAAIAALYLAGMVLNDAVDLEIDRYVRPQRPLPSGRVGLREACILAATLMLVGLLLLARLGTVPFAWGAGLAAVIVAYDLSHHHTAASVLLMGACRGLVYWVAAMAVSATPNHRMLLWCSLIAMTYTVGLSIVARVEEQGRAGRRRWIALVLPVVVLSAALGARAGHPVGMAVAGAVVTVWLGLAARHIMAPRGSVREAVLGWLAGFCLIDMYFLMLLDALPLAGVALAGFLVTVIGHRVVTGT